MSGKRLLLLRHAISISHAAGGDIERNLAPQGVEDAIALGKFMNDGGYKPDLILCSHAQRTRETLESLKQNLEISNISFPKTLYSGSAGDYLYEIQKVSNEYQNILLLAHNPSIYELVILLAGEGSDAVMQKLTMGYKPATLSVLDCKCDKWADIQPMENELVKFLTPMDYN